MDLGDFLKRSSVDLWMLMEATITVASWDEYRSELKHRKESIVELINKATMGPLLSPTKCHAAMVELVELYNDDDGDDHEYHDVLVKLDEHKNKILDIKERLGSLDHQESKASLVELLESIVDMIGEQVRRLKKPENERLLATRVLVGRWVGIVDEWLKLDETRNQVNVADHQVLNESSFEQQQPQPKQKLKLKFRPKKNEAEGAAPENRERNGAPNEEKSVRESSPLPPKKRRGPE